ncbi:type II CAAX endopeptidase family protein [Tropicimonas sp. TH_r6]|uniref:CPBP family intramembrane glutamic endopeptidase n=1 Tax=Tropicimonas sp. TH_r6 TaxID=3082085 RepID=UPI0029550FA6|nr:type II CAAX endopeptidase family protein [Tropicimonas sp. TH_r6]MDV7144719.1 type II CAAX endopeptidase family protein [Tropicimonas sp. TH_r6]
MRYKSHKFYYASARGTAELWRTAAGAVLIFIAGMALYQLTFALVSNLIGPEATQALVDNTTLAKASPFATLYILCAFGFFAIGLAMVTQSLHNRSPATLFGPAAAVVSDALRVTLVVGALFVLLALILPRDVEMIRNAELTRRAWIALLPVSLAAILLQAGTEELIFRGYLQQQLAARFPRLPLWMILPSVLFGLAHLSPAAAGANAPWFALWATAFAFAAADLTARTASIGAALGFHIANNIAAILFISLEGAGSGLALYHLPLGMDDPRIAGMMLPEFAMLFVGWLAARLALKV